MPLPLSNIKRGCATDTIHILFVADGDSHGASGRRPYLSEPMNLEYLLHYALYRLFDCLPPVSAIYSGPVSSLLSKGFTAILNMVFFCLRNTISSKKIILFFDLQLPLHLYKIPFNSLYAPNTLGYPRIFNHPIYSFDSWERSDLP